MVMVFFKEIADKIHGGPVFRLFFMDISSDFFKDSV
jgi:hypothetical protein